MFVKNRKGALIVAFACHSPKSASNCFNPESAYQQDNPNGSNLLRKEISREVRARWAISQYASLEDSHE